MTKTVLVTGGTGFVGKHVVLALSKISEINLILVVRNKKTVFTKEIPNLKEIIETEDLFKESEEFWCQICQGVDMVIHMAWYVEPTIYLNSPKNFACLSGTMNIARGAARAKVHRFVGIGTCFEYDLSAGILSVDTPLRPTTLYASTKAASFSILKSWFSDQSVEFVWCRLFYLYGEGEDERRLASYVRSKLKAGELVMLGSGTQIRDFLNVECAASKIVAASMSDICGPINICSGVPVSVKEFVETLTREYGGSELLRFGVRPDNLTDPICVIGVE